MGGGSASTRVRLSGSTIRLATRDDNWTLVSSHGERALRVKRYLGVDRYHRAIDWPRRARQIAFALGWHRPPWRTVPWPLHSPPPFDRKSARSTAIRVAESEGDRTRDVHALLLSPWPESVYAFEPTWSQLAAHARRGRPPGFGHSERRDALMSPRAMGKFVVRLADELGLEQPHVVGPDIGTGAALFATALHPGRLCSVVGLEPRCFPCNWAPLQEWIEAPDLEPYRRIDGRQIVGAAIGTLERYTDLPALRDLPPEIRTPVQVSAGRRDTVVPLVNAEFLVERLPNSELAVIEAGHFIWEDAADEYAALVTSWWDGATRPPAADPGERCDVEGLLADPTGDVRRRRSACGLPIVHAMADHAVAPIDALGLQRCRTSRGHWIIGVDRGRFGPGADTSSDRQIAKTTRLECLRGRQPAHQTAPRTHLALAAHIRSPGNRLACFTQAAS
jgi:pimeloyl-ACP methyl ester carboxylesterase